MSVSLLVAGTAGALLVGGLAATLLQLRDPLDWLLGASLLAVAHVVVTSLVVGAVVGRYAPIPLLATTAVVCAVLGWATFRLQLRGSTPRAVLTTARRVMTQLEWWQAALVVLAAVALAWRAVVAIALPPFAYDALGYHLPIVGSWVQSEQIGVNPYGACCSHYPSTTELLFAWPTILLGRDDVTDAVQLPLALVGGLAVIGLARWVGLRAPSALAAGSLFLVTPIVLTQANTNYNDVAIASALLAALYHAVRLLDGSRFALGRGVDTSTPAAHALLAGVATGLALGGKYNGTVIAAVIGGLVVTHLVIAVARSTLGVRRALELGGAFLLGTFAIGAWWYARNWVDTGNPFWPFDVSPLGLGLFAGPATVDSYLTVPPAGTQFWLEEVARSWFADLTFWTRTDYSYEERAGGLGPVWSWVGWLAVAWLTVEAARRRRDVLLNLIVPLALVFALLPYRWWSRFTIYLAALAAIALVALITRVRSPWLRSVTATLVVALAAAGVWLSSRTVDPAGFGNKLAAPRVLELALRHDTETVGSLFYPEYRWLDDVPEDAIVAVETEAPSIRWIYPLFGDGLERTIVQLLPGDESRLESLLQERAPQLAAVEAGGAMDAWLAGKPSRFALVFDEGGVRVYRSADESGY